MDTIRGFRNNIELIEPARQHIRSPTQHKNSTCPTLFGISEKCCTASNHGCWPARATSSHPRLRPLHYPRNTSFQQHSPPEPTSTFQSMGQRFSVRLRLPMHPSNRRDQQLLATTIESIPLPWKQRQFSSEMSQPPSLPDLHDPHASCQKRGMVQVPRGNVHHKLDPPVLKLLLKLPLERS